MQSWGWHGTLLRIILLLILLALPSESGKSCPEPPPLPHGRVVSTGNETGALIIYVCNNGDRSSAKCTESGTWYPAPPQCTAGKTGDCTWRDLEDYTTNTHGDFRALPNKVDFKEGETAPYKCMDGFLPASGSPVRDTATCRNSKWERPPNSLLRCNPRSCGHPTRGTFRNGRLNEHVFNFPREVTFTCNPGFHLVTHDDQPWDINTDKFYCQADGTWNMLPPKCVEVVCAQPDPISNGNINVPPGILLENATVQYVCNQGYVLVGPAMRRCTNQVKWEGDSPTCERGCDLPQTPLNARIIAVEKVLTIGVTIIYECGDDTKTTLKCIEPGRWDPDPPTCSAKTTPATPKPKSSSTTSTTTLPPPSQCSPLSSPSNGKLFSVEGFGVNASVIFSCDEGYTLRGSATLVCRPTGAWDPSTMPTCTAPPPWIIILSVCLAVLASLVICCLGFFYIMRRKRRSTPPPRAYRRQIRKPGPYDAMSNDEVARLGKPFPVTSL